MLTLILLLKILVINYILCLQRSTKNKIARITDYNLDYTMFTNTEFIAAIVYGRLLVCGGSRIHKYWILTSGKCVDPKYNEELLTYFGPLGVRLGTSEAKKINAKRIVKYEYKNNTDLPLKELVVAVDQRSVLKVETAVLHPAYSMQKFETKPFLLTQADIALVKLATLPIDNHDTGLLPKKSFTKVSGICEAFGWGADNVENNYFIDEDDDYSQLLLSLVIKIIPEQECQRKIQKNVNRVVSVDMAQNYIQQKLCNFDLDSITLRDVGGPLICEEKVVYGIIDNYFVIEDLKENNLLDGNLRPYVISVFIDVEKYLDWIEATINGTKKVEDDALPRAIEDETTSSGETNNSTQQITSGSGPISNNLIIILLIFNVILY